MTYQVEKYLVISHSFFMKIMDIYIHMGDLFADPSILRDYFNPTKRRIILMKGSLLNYEAEN